MDKITVLPPVMPRKKSATKANYWAKRYAQEREQRLNELMMQPSSPDPEDYSTEAEKLMQEGSPDFQRPIFAIDK